jgi:hypothetical protein
MQPEEIAIEQLARVDALSPEDKAEYERIEASIKQAEEKLALLMKGREVNYKARNQRYVLDLDIPFQAVNFFLPAPSPLVTRDPLAFETSTTIKRDTKFFCTHMECATYALGSRYGQQYTQAIRPYERPDLFVFEWMIRDTGSDRSWQNEFLPDALLMTNRLNPLMMGTPTVISGGSEVFLNLNVQRMRTPIIGDVLTEIKNFSVQISLCGYEVSE